MIEPSCPKGDAIDTSPIPTPAYLMNNKMPITKVLFSLQGRIPRSTFWIWLLILCVIVGIVSTIVLMGMIGAVAATAQGNVDSATGQLTQEAQAGTVAAAGGGILVLCLVTLAAMWPSIALYAKRYHDINKSAWWICIGFVPLIGAIWMLIECGFMEGTKGPNQFGEDPLG
ncbi:MAG: DUF805 domain-containing protein [Verrucomicrobiales bacterium]